MNSRYNIFSSMFTWGSAPTRSFRLNASAPTSHRTVHSASTSVDPAAISHHAKLGEEWWSRSGPMKALHSMNKLRVPMIRDGLLNTGIADIEKTNTPRPLAGVRIIDIGCGGGILSEPLARLGAEVMGIDASEELIGIAQEHAKLDCCLESLLTYKHTTAEEHVENHSSYYDAVVSSEVIEHVSDQNFFLEKCAQLLKPAGSIFLTTLNRTTLSWLGAIIAAEHILKIVPAGTHSWEMFITPSEVQQILESHGCSTKLVHGMCYNPVWDDWSWSKRTDINYAIQAVKAE